MSHLKEAANATKDEQQETASPQEAHLQLLDYGNDDNFDKEPSEDYNSDETNLTQSQSQESKELDEQQQQATDKTEGTVQGNAHAQAPPLFAYMCKKWTV